MSQPGDGNLRGPLRGIRVLDLSTGPVGGVATVVLADFGADVVKLEPPGGDRFRALAASPLWLRGKRSVVADLGQPKGRAEAKQLAAAADVIVLTGSPERAERWGLSASQLSPEHPRLVHCQITPWGPLGPLANLPGYEAVVAARMGRTRVFGRQLRGDAPGFAALPVAQHTCAMGAVQGILAALFARERSGRGARVETSLLQGLLPYDLAELLLVQLADRRGDAPVDTSGGDMPTLNYHPVLAQDGRWIQCGNLMEHLFYAFLESIELLSELLAEDRFQGSPNRWDPETVEAARDRILLRVRERPAKIWMEAFRKNGHVAAEPFLSAEEALRHPDLLANGEIIRIDDPVRGPVHQIGPIAGLSQTPASALLPAPEVGAHGDEVGNLWRHSSAASSATSGAEPSQREPSSSGSGQPLAGVLIVDLSTIIAGPLGVTMLADLGARVIKVEPVSGDAIRRLIPGGVMAPKMNAGKESIAIDLKAPEGQAVLRDLLADADVVVHNFRTGVPERLGLGYEDCHAHNPRLIWVAVQGYGTQGADATRPATHPVVGAAMSGATFQAGPSLSRPCETLDEIRETSRQLMRANESNPDPNTSSVLAAAILVALFARERGSAEGQRIDVSMLVANAWANVDDFLAYGGKPPRPQLDDALLGLAPGYRLYPAQQGWVMLALTSEAEWQRFARAVGNDELLDPQQRTTERIEQVFAKRTADAWQTHLAEHRIACVRADGPAPGRAWLEDEQVRANDFTPRVHHPRFGDIRRWGPIVTVDGPADAYGPGPLLGDATDEVLRETGRDDAAIAALREAGVVGSEDARPVPSG